MTSRHFVVLAIDNKPIMEKINLYSRTPSGAAKKIISIAKKRGLRSVPRQVTLHEVTRNSKHKHYTYAVQKIAIEPYTIFRGGKEITYTFKTIARKV